jgi:Ca2+-binding EF-hand superfamily protein
MGNLQAWFYSVDRDRSGNISASELAVMPIGKEQLGLDAARRLIKAFDRNYSGNIGTFSNQLQFLL